MEILNVVQGSEAWHRARAEMFTGTTFKAINMAPSSAGYQNEIARIAGQIITGGALEKESGTTKAMEDGNLYEPEARAEYEEITGLEVTEVGICIYEHADFPNGEVGYSADGLVGGRGQVEIKCPELKNHLKYITEGVLPKEYYWQVQGGLMVTGREWCDFVSYFPGLKTFILRVTPEQEAHSQLHALLRSTVNEVAKLVEQYNDYEV